jgi:integrase
MKGKILRATAYAVFDINEIAPISMQRHPEHAKRKMCEFTKLTWTQLAETGCRVAEIEIWEKVESKKK